MPRVRVHQHVNPLAPYFRQPPKPVILGEVFANPDLPLHLDVGCARGRFILRMAEAMPEWNFLGVEIREPLVIEANRIGNEKGLGNLHYAFCNAMLWLEKLIEAIPGKRLRTVSIQFPDPWFKKKHAKRRMVNPQLVSVLSAKMEAGAEVFVQTDIEFLANDIWEIFKGDRHFRGKRINENIFPIKTEREIAVEEKRLPVFRSLWTRE